MSAGEREEGGEVMKMDIEMAMDMEMDVYLQPSYAINNGELPELSSDHHPASSHTRFAATILCDTQDTGYEADIGDLENIDNDDNMCVWFFRSGMGSDDRNDGDVEIGADELERRVNQQVRARRRARSGRRERERDGRGEKRGGSQSHSCSRRRGRGLGKG
ncbi:hypothetical protein EX30DRAFT_367401 [Ascodesmis nigricans]|uniref:Uncharacterized protein n=1 Tax=Ascodesmis nigricans TaxID=341454 RepID=A0A4S2MI10_9PEZI|nr:hypothetical protein EX30DRAFT_367401 [Ascodesmis nigricans]